MNFFKKLQEMGITNATMRIRDKEGKISVSFIPEFDSIEELRKLKPVMLTGTATQMDEHFFEEINVFSEDSGLISNIEEVKKGMEAIAKEMEEKAEKAKKSKSKTTTAKDEKKPVVEKPKPVSKFKKYEDPIIEIVEADGFKISEENYSELKDKVDMLSVMDKNSELAKEWEEKLKVYKAEKSSLFAADKATESKPEATPPPPPPPAPEPALTPQSTEDDFNEDDFDFDFDDDDIDL